MISSPEFDGIKTTIDVTNTLRRILWVIEWLQKLQWNIKRADIAINEAINSVEMNLSKVNPHEINKPVRLMIRNSLKNERSDGSIGTPY
jgi:hypothetical protein